MTHSLQNARDGLRKVRDNLRHAFADEANDTAKWISDWNNVISSVSGELDEQLAEVSAQPTLGARGAAARTHRRDSVFVYLRACACVCLCV
jgi:hypothetical protein